MGRIYTASVTAVAVTTAIDLLEIVPAAGRIVVIHAWDLFQTTDFGDAQDEGLGIIVKRGSSGSTSGSGGSTPTPAPHETNAGAASSTVEMMNTTQAVAGGGTLTTVYTSGWNVRAGDPRPFIPEIRIYFGPAERGIVAMTVPADSITMNASFTFEEIG